MTPAAPRVPQAKAETSTAHAHTHTLPCMQECSIAAPMFLRTHKSQACSSHLITVAEAETAANITSSRTHRRPPSTPQTHAVCPNCSRTAGSFGVRPEGSRTRLAGGCSPCLAVINTLGQRINCSLLTQHTGQPLQTEASENQLPGKSWPCVLQGEKSWLGLPVSNMGSSVRS